MLPKLVMNWDQTGIKLMPVRQWTMAPIGSKQVDIVGLDDKKEIIGFPKLDIVYFYEIKTIRGFWWRSEKRWEI